MPAAHIAAYIPVATGWGSEIYPYVKSTGVYKCPDAPTTQAANLNGTGPNESDYPVSYGMNTTLDGHDPGGTLAGQAAPTVLMFEVQGAQADLLNTNDDSTTMISTSPGGDGGDSSNGYIDESCPKCLYATGPSATVGIGNPARTGATYQRLGLPRHTLGVNFALADGHVKYLLPASVSPGFANSNGSCGQDQAGSPCAVYTGTAAGTGGLSVNGVNFAATFSPT